MPEGAFNPNDPIVDGVRRVAGATTRVGRAPVFSGGVIANRDFVSVQIHGIGAIKNNLRAFGEIGRVAAKNANLATAISVLSDTRRTLSQVTPPGQFGADLGDLSARYHITYIKDGGGIGEAGLKNGERVSAHLSDDLAVLVGARSNHAPVVEFGRRAGAKPPPPGALRDWLKRRGLSEDLEYPIAQAIARRGIHPLPHLHPAVEKNRQKHEQNHAKYLKRAMEAATK